MANTPDLDENLDDFQAGEEDATTDDNEVAAGLERPEGLPVRFAVYDCALQRFISGVVDTVEEADEILSTGPAGHDLEIREV